MRGSVGPYIVDRAAIAAEAAANFRHPRFDEAVALYAAAGMDPPSEDPRLAKLVCNVARYTLAVAVLHLDATGGPNGLGATAANLRQMLTTGGFASDGWVKNAVRVFARAGYFDRYPASGDRRAIRVAPSETMIRIAQQAMVPKLAVIELLSPLPTPAEKLIHFPGFVGAMSTHTIVPYLTDGFTELEGFPEIRELVRHDYGYVVYCVIVASMRRAPDGGARRGSSVPPARPALRDVAQPVAGHSRIMPRRGPDHRDRPRGPPSDAHGEFRRALPPVCGLRHRLLEPDGPRRRR